MKAAKIAATAPAQPGPDEILTKKEVADRLRISVRTVDGWRQKGRLPFLKPGKYVLFSWTQVRNHLGHHFGFCLPVQPVTPEATPISPRQKAAGDRKNNNNQQKLKGKAV